MLACWNPHGRNIYHYHLCHLHSSFRFITNHTLLHLISSTFHLLTHCLSCINITPLFSSSKSNSPVCFTSFMGCCIISLWLLWLCYKSKLNQEVSQWTDLDVHNQCDHATYKMPEKKLTENRNMYLKAEHSHESSYILVDNKCVVWEHCTHMFSTSIFEINNNNPSKL